MAEFDGKRSGVRKHWSPAAAIHDRETDTVRRYADNLRINDAARAAAAAGLVR